jgi:hypothetical protein
MIAQVLPRMSLISEGVIVLVMHVLKHLLSDDVRFVSRHEMIKACRGGESAQAYREEYLQSARRWRELKYVSYIYYSTHFVAIYMETLGGNLTVYETLTRHAMRHSEERVAALERAREFADKALGVLLECDFPDPCEQTENECAICTINNMLQAAMAPGGFTRASLAACLQKLL